MASAGPLTMPRCRGMTVTAEDETLVVRPRELLTDELRAAIRANKPTILAELAEAAHYRWRVTLRDGSLFEACCLPETTAAEMRELYPGTTLEPWPNEECKPMHAPTRTRDQPGVIHRKRSARHARQGRLPHPNSAPW